MASTTCAYCKRLTHMTPFTRTVNVLLGQSPTSQNARQAVESPFRCDNCGRMAICFGISRGNPNEMAETAKFGWADSDVGWEPRTGVGREYPDVPEHIAPAASEAHACQSIAAHRAAIMLARAVIEATAKHKGITKGLLGSKIDQMFEQQILREHVKEQAHEVRYLGNDMAHGDFVEPVTQEDAEEVLEIMAEVLDEAFQSQARLQRVKDARLAKKQK